MCVLIGITSVVAQILVPLAGMLAGATSAARWSAP